MDKQSTELRKILKKTRNQMIIYTIAIIALIVVDCILFEKINILSYIASALIFIVYGIGLGNYFTMSGVTDVIENIEDDDDDTKVTCDEKI